MFSLEKMCLVVVSTTQAIESSRLFDPEEWLESVRYSFDREAPVTRGVTDPRCSGAQWWCCAEGVASVEEELESSSSEAQPLAATTRTREVRNRIRCRIFMNSRWFLYKRDAFA